MAGGGTEHVGTRFRDLDRWSTGDGLEPLWAGQSRAVAAVLAALPAIGAAIDAAAARLGATGRLIYVGAGASAVLGALDGLELTPTFNGPASRVVVVLAGIADLHDGFDGPAPSPSARSRRQGRAARSPWASPATPARHSLLPSSIRSRFRPEMR
jgi:N-acetylmuramic acid 6-phosphate etherase